MSAKTIRVSGQSETEKLIQFVNQHGLEKTAREYGTNPSSLSRWIRSQGYQLRRTYVLTHNAKELMNNA